MKIIAYLIELNHYILSIADAFNVVILKLLLLIRVDTTELKLTSILAIAVIKVYELNVVVIRNKLHVVVIMLLLIRVDITELKLHVYMVANKHYCY